MVNKRNKIKYVDIQNNLINSIVLLINEGNI